ncbi:helix-turn-helix domain-containing protein [Streptomyces sp. NPDC057620]|uniref:helix-turn-helix domain-containing protein n=1 Tax=Streptomyces sp. NPDC057620 TaxID=3346185 RepID=UPI0036B462DE
MPSAAPPPDWVLARRRAVGRQIREARLYANLTQEKVALDTGIDRPSIVRIEQGQQSPTLDTLIRIAAAIGVPLAHLVR